MDPLEILGGHKLIDFLLDEPKILQAELRVEVNKIREDRFASGLNLIQRIIGDDKERRHMFRKNGLLKKEMSCVSIFVQTNLERCIWSNWRKSADVLIKYIMSIDSSADNYSLMMRVLPSLINSEVSYNEFREFFETDDDVTSKKLRFEQIVYD